MDWMMAPTWHRNTRSEIPPSDLSLVDKSVTEQKLKLSTDILSVGA